MQYQATIIHPGKTYDTIQRTNCIDWTGFEHIKEETELDTRLENLENFKYRNCKILQEFIHCSGGNLIYLVEVSFPDKKRYLVIDGEGLKNFRPIEHLKKELFSLD